MRLAVPFAIAALVAASLTAASGAGPATAANVHHEKFTDVFTGDPFDCDGTLVQDSGVIKVIFKINRRGSSPFPYFAEHAHGTVVHTNLDTGGTFTEIFRSNSTDHKIVDNGDGTITITVRAAGGSRFYDQYGNFVLKDPGTTWFAFDVDYNGTPGDPEDDEEIEDSFRVIKPSTGNSDFSDRDFCEDVRTYTS